MSTGTHSPFQDFSFISQCLKGSVVRLTRVEEENDDNYDDEEQEDE